MSDDLHVRECPACGHYNDFHSGDGSSTACPDCGSPVTRRVNPEKPLPPATQFIVAEVSKNWFRKQGTRRKVTLSNESDFEPATNGPLLAQLFELVINENWARGYTLQSFQLNRTMIDPDQLNETIIAVFRS